MPENPKEQPTFASVLESLMAGRGLNQAALARGLGVWDANVGRWRKGGGIEIENVRKIADFFGVDRGHLEQLAGYGDSTPSSTDDSAGTIDPTIAALLDAERAETHEELASIEQRFWPIILEAGRVARKAAVEIARMATAGQSIGTPKSQVISKPRRRGRNLSDSGQTPSGQPEAGVYVFAQAY